MSWAATLVHYRSKFVHRFALLRSGDGWASIDRALQGNEEQKGGLLLVMPHSRGTLDILALHCALFLSAKTNDDLPTCIIHPMFFALPPVAAICRRLNCIAAGDAASFVDAVNASSLVLLAPGGSHEMLKSPCEINRVLWRAEPPFAKLALAHKWRVVPVAVSNAEWALFNPLWYVGWHWLLRGLMRLSRRQQRQQQQQQQQQQQLQLEQQLQEIRAQQEQCRRFQQQLEEKLQKLQPQPQPARPPLANFSFLGHAMPPMIFNTAPLTSHT